MQAFGKSWVARLLRARQRDCWSDIVAADDSVLWSVGWIAWPLKARLRDY